MAARGGCRRSRTERENGGGGCDMDVKKGNAGRAKTNTSIAEQAERRRTRIGALCERIQKILQEHEGPQDLAAIEFFLKAEQRDRGERIESLDTFEVRDAVSELVRTGVAEYIWGAVRLAPKDPDQ
jgi:hypothetical protein